MSRNLAWRRRLTAGAVMAVAAAGLVACGSSGDGGTPTTTVTTPNGDSFIGGKPTGTPSATSGNTGGNNGGGNTGSGGGTTGPTYPSDAKSYGLAFLSALAQKDQNRMKALATQSTIAQVTDGFYDNVNSQWTNRSCGTDPNNPGDPNKIACVYDNAHGDEIKLVINKTQLGGSAAVLEAPLDKTTYPTDPGQYAANMLSAYETGNLNRAVRLSNQTVKGKLSCKLESHTVGSVTPIDGSTSKVVINDGNAGHSYTFTVLTQPGGKAGAVKDVTDKQCGA